MLNLFFFSQILIEGTVGDDFNGDIAIDDLSFFDCAPYEGKLYHKRKSDGYRAALVLTLSSLSSIVEGELPANTTITAATTPAPTDRPHGCSDGEFVCGVSRECVPTSKVCDFRRDCSDGSDEINCGKMFLFLSLFLYGYPPLSMCP